MVAKFKSADERANEPVISKGLIIGLPGAGKTHLLHTLNPKTTLFLNLDKGGLTVKNSKVEYEFVIDSWEDLRDFAVLFGGSINGLEEKEDYKTEYTPYTLDHRKRVIKEFSEEYGEDFMKKMMSDVKTILIDSITEGSNFCDVYVKKNKKTYSKGQPDGFKYWALMKTELEGLMRRFQDSKTCDVWTVGQIGNRVNAKTEEAEYYIDVAGSFKRTVLQIPDHVFYIEEVFKKDGGSYRQIRTKGSLDFLNGLQLKSRCNTLDAIERPDLSYLSEKIKEEKKTKPKKEKETK